jgi:roadblock/LC7 domain-containing protein
MDWCESEQSERNWGVKIRGQQIAFPAILASSQFAASGRLAGYQNDSPNKKTIGSAKLLAILIAKMHSV